MRKIFCGRGALAASQSEAASSSSTRRGRRVHGTCALLSLLLLAGCARTPPVERLEWTTMGTVAAVQLRGASSAETAKVVSSVKNSFARIERLLNAHDPNSELSQLAARPDAEVLARCDPSVRNCYAAAFALTRQSGGAFSPRWRGPKTLDLGAVAKGFAVDVAADALKDSSGDILIDLGGNLKSVRGTWRVGIAESDRTLVLSNGMACATSAEYFRGKHIRDARTGQAVSNGVFSVTVIHPSSAMLADGLSTILFICGQNDGERFLSSHHPSAQTVWLMRQTNSKR